MLIHNAIITGSLSINGTGYNTGSFSGSFIGAVAGTTATASYVEYNNVANKPALVSGSSQITYSDLTGIPSGIVSSSAQITGYGIFATTGSNQFNGNQTITGSLTVTGQVVAQTLNVQQVTSSIVYSSGSNIFGNSLANTQQFTGSVGVTGSLTVAGAGSVSSTLTTGADVNLESNESYLNLFSTYSVGLNSRARIRAVGAGGGSGYGGDFRVSTRATNNTWNTDVLTVNSSGNVGIGTNNPSTLLHVSGSSSSIGRIVSTFALSSGFSDVVQILNPNQTGGGLSFNIGKAESTRNLGKIVYAHSSDGSTSNRLAFGFYDADNLLNLTAGGNVGIGTTSPSGKLDIFSSNDVYTNITTSGTNVSAVLSLYNSTATGDGAAICYNVAMRFGTVTGLNGSGFTERMRITSGGNVGIGTTSPINIGSGYIGLSVAGDNTSGRGGYLSLMRSTTETFRIISNSTQTEMFTMENTPLVIGTNSTERLRITSGGNVGIGTTNPNASLQVGNGTQAGINGASNKVHIATTGTRSALLTLANSSGGTTVEGQFESSAESADLRVIIGSTSNHPVVFRANNSEAMRITSGGYIGIGNAVNGTGYAIEIARDANTPRIDLVDNGVYTGQFKSNSGILTVQNSSNNALVLGTNNTERIRITSGGDVGIGSTSPPEKLYVNGRIRTLEGNISPTFYIARNYANAWGSASGYDDIGVGGIINLLDHSVGGLNAFMHGQMSPVANGGESISWNSFRILFRWTRSTASYTTSTVGFKISGYFYSGGWYDASPEFSVNGGTDSDRGPRWGASPWLNYGSFSNGADVPGIGLKLHSSSEGGIILRVHAAYIQYKY